MRDPFDAPVDLINPDHNGGNKLSRTGAVSAGDYGLQNGPKSFAPNSDTLVRSFLLEQKDLLQTFSFILLTSFLNEAISCVGRHQVQVASLHKDLVLEDPNTRIMDPETKVNCSDFGKVAI
jgi:hypothetical protein